MRQGLLIAVVSLTVLAAPVRAVHGQQTQRGAITGRVSDAGGGGLLGVIITVTGTEMQRQAVTSTGGIYRFDNLPPGTYRIQAALAGYRGGAAQSVAVTAGVTTTHDVVLRPGILWIVDYVLPQDGIQGALREASAVVHLQIAESLGPRLRHNESMIVTEHRAKVLAVVKADAAAIGVGREILFDQESAGEWLENGQRSVGIETPYRPGSAFVAFLRRNPDSTLAEYRGMHYMWPASKGFVIIQNPAGTMPPGLSGRMTVEECLAILRKLAAP